MSIPLQRADEAFLTFMMILGSIFVVIWLVLNLMLHWLIIKRIDQIANRDYRFHSDPQLHEYKRKHGIRCNDERNGLYHRYRRQTSQLFR